jgi:glycosyltransferase involved in cell wall biosynthesis
MIVHMITDRFSLGGGVEHIYQVVNGIRNIRFTVFARPATTKHKAESRLVRKKFSSLSHVELQEVNYSPGHVKKQRPDLIHFHHLLPLFHFYWNPFRKQSIPVIFTAHGLHIHKYEFSTHSWFQNRLNRIKYWLRFLLEKYLLGRVDRVIAVSREDQRFLELNYGLNNITYITNGIIIDKSETGDTTARIDLRKSLDLPQEGFLFVTVARFNFQKAYDFLINTLGSIKHFLDKTGTCFVLVGGGPELDALQRKATELGLDKRIVFLGERKDSLRLIRAGNVFLLPSRWEGLPIVLLECGLLKVPVIASDTYGNREIIGAHNGILFENLNPQDLIHVIKKAVNGEYQWERMINSLNREVNQHYSIETMLSKLNSLYNS